MARRITLSPDVLVQDGDLLIRRMRDVPADHAIMARWLADER